MKKAASQIERKRSVGRSVGPSVWPFVGDDCEFWKNGWLDRDAVWGMVDRVGQDVLDRGSDPPCEVAILGVT